MKKKILTLDDYQRAASRTAIYPHQGKNLIYTVLGLAGEAGELANKIKKLMRSGGFETGMSLTDLWNNIHKIKNDKLRKKMLTVYNSLEGEMGGILWYLAACSTEFSRDLNHIGLLNLDELSHRVNKNEVEGEGDDR